MQFSIFYSTLSHENRLFRSFLALKIPKISSSTKDMTIIINQVSFWGDRLIQMFLPKIQGLQEKTVCLCSRIVPFFPDILLVGSKFLSLKHYFMVYKQNCMGIRFSEKDFSPSFIAFNFRNFFLRKLQEPLRIFVFNCISF